MEHYENSMLRPTVHNPKDDPPYTLQDYYDSKNSISSMEYMRMMMEEIKHEHENTTK